MEGCTISLRYPVADVWRSSIFSSTEWNDPCCLVHERTCSCSFHCNKNGASKLECSFLVILWGEKFHKSVTRKRLNHSSPMILRLNLLPHRISRTLWRYFPGIWTKVIIQFPINMRHKKCCKYFTCFAIACMPLKLSNACWSARSVRFRFQKDANLYLGLPTLRKTQIDTC